VTIVTLAIAAATCGAGVTGSLSEAPNPPPLDAPFVPSGPTGRQLTEDLHWIATPVVELLDVARVREMAAHGDIRAAWVLVDVLRFI
jgi:hypothetical protein